MGSQQGPRQGEPTVARRLEDRVVVVTGGNGGIGLGMARGLADAGATVAVWARDPDKNAAAREELAARGADVEAWVVDVAEEAEVTAAMASTLDRFGRVDAMIANAGVGGPVPFVDQTLEGWRRIAAVNVEGAFLCFRTACRHMIDRGGGGALVGISSTSALQGAPANQAYSCSKAAVVAMVRGLAVEMARHEIRRQRHPAGLDPHGHDRTADGLGEVHAQHHRADPGAAVGRARGLRGRRCVPRRSHAGVPHR